MLLQNHAMDRECHYGRVGCQVESCRLEAVWDVCGQRSHVWMMKLGCIGRDGRCMLALFAVCVVVPAAYLRLRN
jgi:hypothetical protein